LLYELLLKRIEVLVNDSTSTISVYLFELKPSSNFYAYLNKLSINYDRIIFIGAYAQLVNLNHSIISSRFFHPGIS
jgi:hypothetical protein